MIKKFIQRPNWGRVISRLDKTVYYENEDFCGHVHYLKMRRVTKKLYDTKFKTNEILIDNNYTWVMFLPDNGYYCLTAQFNYKDEIIQLYFDIICGSGVSGKYIYFWDIYTDIIVYKDKTIMIDDLDELEEAYKSNDITTKQYEEALKNTYELHDIIAKDVDYWFVFARKYFEKSLVYNFYHK